MQSGGRNKAKHQDGDGDRGSVGKRDALVVAAWARCPFGETATLGHVLLRDAVPCVFGEARACVWSASTVWRTSCLEGLVFEVPAAMELSR